MKNVTDSQFAKVFNDTEKYPTLKDVADKLGIKIQTVKNRAGRMRKAHENDPKKPKVIHRGGPATGYKLMSESQRKFSGDMSPEECIAELRRVAEEHPDKVITRNFFRVNGNIAESVWNGHFGTFEEFKRQANIKISRGAHAMERKVAIHASRDVYRRIGEEREDKDLGYTRDNGKKYKTILVGTDLHDVECDPFWLRVFIDTAKRIQPDVICLNGDVFDLPEFGRYNVDPREWDVVGRIQHVHEEILSPLREVAPDAQIDFIEGNHERRLLIHLADATPALRAVLADLHGLTVSQLLGLDRFEVNYVAKGDLAATNKRDMNRELEKSYKNYWDCFLAHHFPHARSMGVPGWNGHHHSHKLWQQYSPIYGPYEWHQVGAGHRRMADYCEGERWANGFLVANCNTETKSTIMDYVQLTDFAVVAGEFYYRTKVEGLGNPAVWPGR